MPNKADNRQYARAVNSGRPKKFATPDELWQAACEYFQWCVDNPLQETVFVGFDKHAVVLDRPRAMSVSGLCLFLGVNTRYLDHLKLRAEKGEIKHHAEYSPVLLRAYKVIYVYNYELAAAGLLNPEFLSRVLTMQTKTEKKERVIIYQPVFQVNLLHNCTI